MKFITYLLGGAALCTPASAFAPSSSAPSSRAANTRLAAADADAAAPAPTANPIIKLAANGMSVLKPIFAVEAQLQAAALGAIGNVDKEAVASEIASMKESNRVLIYTYGLSPFSTEALSMLDASGCEYTNVELGKEWFLLGGKESETRVALAREVEGGATSLPKIFIGGECIGGCAELASLVESGELDAKLKSANAKTKGGNDGKPNFFTSLFG